MLIFLIICSCVIAINAQSKDYNPFYATAELSLGNYVGIDFNMNYILKEKFSFSLGYNTNFRRSQSKPSNYSPGLFQLLSLGLSSPYDFQESFQLGIGRIIKLNKSGTTRVNLIIGIAATRLKEAGNWAALKNRPIIDSNYSWNYVRSSTPSFIFNPKFEFPFSNSIGLTLSPKIVINDNSAYYGLGVGGMIGFLRS